MQARSALASDLISDIEITYVCADNLMLLLGVIAERLAVASTSRGQKV
jgi:hypothetical protein